MGKLLIEHVQIRLILILIYDRNESEAWLTFEHEVYDCKFKEVTFPYRTLVNSLIETVEKLTYERKEKFIDSLPRISEIIYRRENALTRREDRRKKKRRVVFSCLVAAEVAGLLFLFVFS